MTTTQITNIAHLMDLTDYAGDFFDSYDMDEVHEDWLTEIQARVPRGVTICNNGDVIAELDVAEEARGIDWGAITEDIDPAPIFERHERDS